MRVEDWREGNCKRKKGNSKVYYQIIHHYGRVGLDLTGYLLRSDTERTCLRLSTWEIEEVSVIQWCVGACLSQLGTAYCAYLLPTLRSATSGRWLEINHGGKKLHHGNWWMLQIGALFVRELDVKHWPAYCLKYVSTGSHPPVVWGHLVAHECPCSCKSAETSKGWEGLCRQFTRWRNPLSSSKVLAGDTCSCGSPARTEVKRLVKVGWRVGWARHRKYLIQASLMFRQFFQVCVHLPVHAST